MTQEFLKTVSTPPAPFRCSTPTTNACSLCMPLGACLAFRGIAGCVPFLHGSQGCATYIRRYLISHFREPMDIASSSFDEQSVVFGGRNNLHEGLLNVIRQYKPEMIGMATTCLAETIGDDPTLFLNEFRATYGAQADLPTLVAVPTPSYSGDHTEGYWRAVHAVLEAVAVRTTPDSERIGLVPGMVSPADLRHLHAIMKAFHLRYTLLPDYAETLDGGSWEDYTAMPPGGTPLSAIQGLGDAGALLSFTVCMPDLARPGAALDRRFGVTPIDMPRPIGVEATDRLLRLFSEWAGLSIPAALQQERARLVDAYIDAHKITAGKRVAIFGDADFALSMTAFAVEIGLRPVVCAAGGRAARFAAAVQEATGLSPEDCLIRDEVDYADIEAEVSARGAELLLGSSKAYAMSRRLDLPLVRAGFPVHDRIDGPRMLSLGYRGAQQLFDRVCTALMEHRQRTSPVGFSYM